MVSADDTFDAVSQELIKNHLGLTALIQDIQKCDGPLEYLNELNADGRVKIAALRNNIEQLTDISNRERDKKKKSELLSEIESHRGQLTRAIIAFRKANVVSACAIDKKSRDDLFSSPEQNEQQSALRNRKDRQSVSNKSSKITEKLLDISKFLSETTQRSAETLDSLATSSDKVGSTKKELEQQQQAIVQSGKLLGKYGRREITDKVLLALAFIFFLACVFYILQKRLF